RTAGTADPGPVGPAAGGERCPDLRGDLRAPPTGARKPHGPCCGQHEAERTPACDQPAVLTALSGGDAPWGCESSSPLSAEPATWRVSSPLSASLQASRAFSWRARRPPCAPGAGGGPQAAGGGGAPRPWR